MEFDETYAKLIASFGYFYNWQDLIYLMIFGLQVAMLGWNQVALLEDRAPLWTCRLAKESLEINCQ